MDSMSILGWVMTKSMKEDLEFYLKHNKELYFKGMVIIACAWVGILIMGIWVFVSDITIGMMMMLFGALGFGIVKMYLHIRKDAIEIKERLHTLYIHTTPPTEEWPGWWGRK